MEQKASYLSSFIEGVYDETSLSIRRTTIFAGDQGYKPVLRSGRVNRILLYPGYFNPPHQGHLALLRYVFTQCKDHRNIIAAIVIPRDDDLLLRKCYGNNETVRFTKDRRVSLWQGNGISSSWYWVYDRTEKEWVKFRSLLHEGFEKEGFIVKYALLCGPDHVRVQSLPPVYSWDCEEIIVSDISRVADFVTPMEDNLATLQGCEPWFLVNFKTTKASEKKRNVNVEVESQLDSSRADTLSTVSSPSMEAGGKWQLREEPRVAILMISDLSSLERITDGEPVGEASSGVAVWVCHRRDRTRAAIFFVPRKDKILNISSSQIRSMIRNYPPNHLEKALIQEALNPTILMTMLEEMGLASFQDEIAHKSPFGKRNIEN